MRVRNHLTEYWHQIIQQRSIIYLSHILAYQAPIYYIIINFKMSSHQIVENIYFPHLYNPSTNLLNPHLYQPYFWVNFTDFQLQFPTEVPKIDQNNAPTNQSLMIETKLEQQIQHKNEQVKNELIQKTKKSKRKKFQTIKVAQNKTKDIMRPIVRMLYSHFKRLLQNSYAFNQMQSQQVKFFTHRVDQMRSKHPCKFTQIIMNFLKTASQGMSIIVEEFVNGRQFFMQISKNQFFKHWKDRNELISFIRQFLTNNRQFMKPTKFYKLKFRKYY